MTAAPSADPLVGDFPAPEVLSPAGVEEAALAVVREQARLEARLVRYAVELVLAELWFLPAPPGTGRMVPFVDGREYVESGAPVADVDDLVDPQDLNQAFDMAAPMLAARLGRRRDDCRRYVTVAWGLATEFSATLAALEEGVLEYGHAEVLAEELNRLVDKPEHRARIEAEMLTWLRHEQVVNNARKTKGQLRRRVIKAIQQVDADAARRRYREAVRRRGVWLDTHDGTYDGTATLGLRGIPIDTAVELHSRLLHQARQLHGAGDERSVGQIAHDLALHQLTGRHHHDNHDDGDDQPAGGTTGRPRGTVLLTVPLADVFDHQPLDSGDAELVGHGPVPAEVARRIVVNQLDNPHVDYLVACTDQRGTLTQLHKLDKNRYFTGILHTSIDAYWTTCAHPLCETPAVACRGNHRRDHAQGGPTTQHNGNPLCLVHDGDVLDRGWTKTPVTGRPDQITWTDPHGQTYTTTAPPLVEPEPTAKTKPEPRETDQPPPWNRSH